MAHSELLYKIRTVLDQNGYEGFFINARTDTYFQKETSLLETIERAKAFMESGANGIFIPGLSKEEEIKEIICHVKEPLNVLSLPELTHANKLSQLGVKRLSFGNALSEKVIAYIDEQARQLWESKETSLLYKS